MKVKELMNELKDVDPEREVVLSKDAEGNDYRFLYTLDTDMFFDTKELYVFDEEERKEEHYPTKDCVKAVVLWPCD